MTDRDKIFELEQRAIVGATYELVLSSLHETSGRRHKLFKNIPINIIVGAQLNGVAQAICTLARSTRDPVGFVNEFSEFCNKHAATIFEGKVK